MPSGINALTFHMSFIKHFRSCWNHIHGDASDRNIYTSAFQDFASKEADRWFEVIRNWLILGQQVHVVYYEEFCFYVTMEKAITFLEILYTKEQIFLIECIFSVIRIENNHI